MATKTKKKPVTKTTGDRFPVKLCPLNGSRVENVFATSETEVAVGRARVIKSESVPIGEYLFLFTDKSEARKIRKAAHDLGLMKIATAKAVQPEPAAPVPLGEFDNPER